MYTTCDYNPCENGGTCWYHAGTYFCTCPDEFVRERCEYECKFFASTIVVCGISVIVCIALILVDIGLIKNEEVN